MKQNTTKSGRLQLPWRGRAALAGALLAAMIVAGCTSARQRDEPTNLAGTLRFRNAETFHYFQDVYRSGNLYQDFRPVMVVDAIYEAREYRELYVDMLERRFLIAKEETERIRAEQRREYSSSMDFLLLVWGGTNKKVNIHRPNATWKVFLRDDEGELISPSQMRRIDTKSPLYLFLQKYFTGLDRWSELVRVRFPKLDKALLNKAPGDQPFQLIVTGVPGSVTMSWEDAGMFFSSSP